MTSQDYSTNCVSDEPEGEDHSHQSESETELQILSVGEPIVTQNPKAAAREVIDQNPSVESPVPYLQTTLPASTSIDNPHTNSDEFYPGKEDIARNYLQYYKQKISSFVLIGRIDFSHPNRTMFL